MSFFDFFPREQKGIVKAFILKLYKDKGFKIHEISQALGISTRTVWKTIIKYRNYKKISR